MNDMEKNKKIPQVRFKGYSDVWEQRKLGEVSDSYSGGTPTVGAKEYYGGQIPFIRSAEINSEITEIFITEEGLKNSSARLVDIGDILYALYGATSGEVGRARLKGAINQAILAIKPHSGYDSEYLAQWLRKSKRSIIETYLQGGQGNLSGTIVKDLLVEFPTLNEQQEIGAYLHYLDHLITLHQRKYDKLINVKKAMLEKMFPKNGSLYPEIRFEGFTDAWEQRKWKDTVDISTEMVNPKLSCYENLPHVAPGNIESFTGQLYDNIKSVKEENLISGKFHFYADDVVYGKINPQLGKYFYARFEGLTSADAYVLNAKNKLDQKFLFVLLQTADFFKYSVSVSKRSGIPKINRDELNAFTYYAPTKQEQSQIGQFFLELDDLITLHQRKLEKLKNIKKSCLEKMFV